MALTLGVAVFCDDVREEVGNKLTLVGLYNDGINFQPGQGPYGLPKLASVFVLRGISGVGRLQVRHSVTVTPAGVDPSTVVAPAPTMVIDRPLEVRQLDQQNLVQFAIPVVFPSSPSVLRATLSVETDTGERLEYAHQIVAQRLAPGAALPVGASLPPGSRPMN